MAFEEYPEYPKIILHIDDDQDDRYLVRHAINNIDPSIILREAQDGRKAIDFLSQAKLFGDLPCMIILDINMPVMDGYDTYKEISKDDVLSAIPIVIFTTSRNSEELNYWKQKNIEVVSKPASFDEFTNSIKRVLGFFSSTFKKISVLVKCLYAVLLYHRLLTFLFRLLWVLACTIHSRPLKFPIREKSIK